MYSPSKIYLAVKNFLDNTCGANPGEIREQIQSYVKERVDAHIATYMASLDKYTEEHVQKVTRDRVDYWRQQFERSSKYEIQKAIEEAVKNELQTALAIKGISVEIKLPANVKTFLGEKVGVKN